jgi:glycosyltransferase involved in cell wall biosynthesis
MINDKANRPDLSVVILCYRAGDSVRQFVDNVVKTLKDSDVNNYELVLVGNFFDQSDITPRIVADIASKNSRIKYIAEKKQGMMGWDMRSGLALTDGEYIAVIDGDGQMPVGDLVRVYQKIRDEDFDLVKTYRIKRGDTAWRKIISFFYNLFFHLLFPGLKARDINSKPKIFTRWAFEKFNLKSDDWFIDAEIMIQARRHKLKIGELPTVFLGLSGRRSFVKIKAIFEFIRNLIVYRIIEFMK